MLGRSVGLRARSPQSDECRCLSSRASRLSRGRVAVPVSPVWQSGSQQSFCFVFMPLTYRGTHSHSVTHKFKTRPHVAKRSGVLVTACPAHSSTGQSERHDSRHDVDDTRPPARTLRLTAPSLSLSLGPPTHHTHLISHPTAPPFHRGAVRHRPCDVHALVVVSQRVTPPPQRMPQSSPRPRLSRAGSQHIRAPPVRASRPRAQAALLWRAMRASARLRSSLMWPVAMSTCPRKLAHRE